MTSKSPPTDVDAIRDMTMQTTSSSSYGDEVEQVSSGVTVDSDLTPFLKGRLPAKPIQHGLPRSAEKIVKRTRRMRWLDSFEDVKWDNDDDTGVEIHRFQVNQLRNSACEIAWTCWPEGSHLPVEYSGQGGLVRGPDGTIKFLTANHNICSEANRDGVWEDAQHGHRCITVQGRCNRLLYIPNTGWERTEKWTKENSYCLGNDEVRRGMSWKTGVDVSLGPEVSVDEETAKTHFLLSKLRVNDIVPDDFVYKLGMKLGMSVFTEDGPNYEEESLVNAMDRKELQTIIGNARELVIFTGKITFVGEEHIEHDLNGFGGCSGGHLIILEKGHEHFGKVAAVHVGSKVGLNANVGFKVAKAFSRF